MYAIVVKGEIIAMQDAPRYVKRNPETGALIECNREEAEGIAANSTAYNIRGGTAFDTPEAEAKEIESGEVLVQTENNRKALNALLGVTEAAIPQDAELSYADKLMHSYTESTEDAAALEGVRGSLDNLVLKIVDSPAEINQNMAAIRKWEPGPFSAGDGTTPPDVRMHEGIPYKCNQSHDSTGNPAWNPKDAPALWSQYHGTTPQTARPFIQPTGAHDMYLKGEYAIFDGGAIKRAKEDTAYHPDVYPDAWEEWSDGA